MSEYNPPLDPNDPYDLEHDPSIGGDEALLKIWEGWHPTPKVEEPTPLYGDLLFDDDCFDYDPYDEGYDDPYCDYYDDGQYDDDPSPF